MKVMVTGGTGYVGAHSARALMDAGHEVRMLIRSRDKFAQTGVVPPSFVEGDMTDPGAVAEALEGCDAVLHCAAVVALDRKRAAAVMVANPRGAEVVLGAAVERRLDPIIHVSSVSAVFKPGLALVTTDLPPTDWGSGYGQSKAGAEVIARAHQAAGHPVTITYPGTVTGPPAGTIKGEIADVIATHLKAGVMPSAGAWSIVDVRDLAAVHVAALEPGQGPRRFMCGGNYLKMAELAAIYRELTGRRLPTVPTPGAVLRAFGSVMDGLMRVTPMQSLISAEGMAILTGWAPTDDHLVHEQLGVEWRGTKETLAAVLAG
jgi:dihydroflavonol-4-reductase